MTTYIFKAYVTVNDAKALLAAALANAVAAGENESDVLARLTDDGEILESVCIQQLLDPGVSPDGCDIEESACSAEGTD